MATTIVATTTGLGPFRPAIRWNDNVWQHPSRSFDKEDDAIEYANKIMVQVGDAINDALKSEDFAPE